MVVHDGCAVERATIGVHAAPVHETGPMWRGTRLTDGTVELRAPRRGDAAELHDAVRASLPELAPWMPWAHPGYSETDAVEWVRRAGRAFNDGAEFQFVVRDVRGGQLLGAVGLNAIDRVNRWGTLGYWIRTDRTGEGIASRSARLVADFGLGELRLQRIEILAAVGNGPSRRVAERLGALHEGTLRRRLRVGDDIQDAAVFSLV
jgi:RimJ/RimL family protein N-acetyltransferase